jgi:hypothetical protein
MIDSPWASAIGAAVATARVSGLVVDRRQREWREGVGELQRLPLATFG